MPYHIELEKGEYFEINRTVYDKLFRHHNIYFQSERFGIEVYINDTLIYSLNRNDAFVNRIHVDTMMLVRLDKAEIGDTLKIRFINIENEKIIKDLPNIYAGSVMAFMDKISAEESITFISFILMTALLIVFIGFIIISLKKNMLEKRFISFTLFMIACAIWLLTDSSVLSIYPVSYEAVAIVSYFASKCMPLGILYFSKQSYKDGKTILIDIAIAITFANVIGSSIILLFSLIPLSKLVIVDQVVLIISAVACMLYNILFIKRNKNQTQPKILLTDFIVISILGICGLICYYLYDSFVYHKIITLAIVVFVIGLIAIMIYSSLQDSKLKKKMMKERELFKELSYKDELTGLGNVRAYNEKLDTLFNNNNDFTLIIIDVNNIKRINDSYGHGAGNIVLLQCAQCMSKTFEQYNGTSYRIGGDEFACIVDSDSFDAQTVIDNFNDIIKATNGDRIYKLSAAVGYSGSKDKDVHTVQDLKFHADLSMYKDKSNKKSREDDKENEEWRRMIETVVSIFEVKDPYTAQHSNRVSYISKFIAQSMGLTEVVVNDVFIAGRIHDIGKIGISDNILTKKGKLTNEEFAEIKKHPEIGEKVILFCRLKNNCAITS